jgi:phospholipase/carboxylesterase
VNPHLDQPLETAGATLGATSVVAVVVHGRDQEPAYMLEHLVGPLHRPEVTYLLPAADDRTWYPTSFLAAVADNEPRLGHALDRMETLRRDLARAGIDDSAVVWVGFSQGACVVTEYVARSTHRFGGLVSLTGGLIGPPETALTEPRAVHGLAAFFGASDVDPFVPLERVEVTARAFEAAGAVVSTAVYPGAVHEIVADEVEQCGRILDLVERRVHPG